MLRDLGSFLKDVFNSWWGRVGVANGVLSYSGRVVDLGPLAPYIAPAFVTLGVACLVVGVFEAYRRQRQEVRRLQERLNQQQNSAMILIRKLHGEVAYTLDHLTKRPVVVHDEAWKAFGPAELKFLPVKIQDAAADFYRDLRSFRAIWDGPPHPHVSAFERRKELQRALSVKGQDLMTKLAKAAAGPAAP